VTKRKKATERRPARQPDDAERSAVEACQLLGLGNEPSRLCAADRLKVDLVSTLRLVIDHAGAVALEGGTADIGRLVGAVEQLTRLLPKTVVEPVPHRPDPRKALLDIILTMKANGEIADRDEPSLRERVAVLEAENANLRAAVRAAGLAVVPREVDIVPPSERADRDPGMRPGPDDPKPVTIEGKAEPADVDALDIRHGYNSAPEPWRDFSTDVEGNPLTPRGRRY
jgi:hypothetical protein